MTAPIYKYRVKVLIQTADEGTPDVALPGAVVMDMDITPNPPDGAFNEYVYLAVLSTEVGLALGKQIEARVKRFLTGGMGV